MRSTLRKMAAGTMTIATQKFRMSETVRRDDISAVTLDVYVEEECGSDAKLHEAYVGYQEPETS